MEESLQCSHNLPRHSRMWQASILVRAHVHGWRHMGGAHMRVDGVAVALVSGLDSCDSPSALSVPRAHSSHPAALVGPPRCSRLYASKAPAVACSDHGRSVRVSRAVGPAFLTRTHRKRSRTTTAGGVQARSIYYIRRRSRQKT